MQSEWLSSMNRTTNADQDAGQGAPLFTVGGRVQTSTTVLEINMEASHEFNNGAVLFS